LKLTPLDYQILEFIKKEQQVSSEAIIKQFNAKIEPSPYLKSGYISLTNELYSITEIGEKALQNYLYQQTAPIAQTSNITSPIPTMLYLLATIIAIISFIFLTIKN